MTLKINSRRQRRVKVKVADLVSGLSDDEVVEVLYRVAREVAPKYKFGYHSGEDMIQLAVQKGLEVLKEQKFVPRSDKDLVKQLAAFMRVHMRNRCSNEVRNKSCRYTNKDSKINKSKYNIMHPLYIYNQNLKEDFFVQGENDRNELHDCLDYIRVNLSPEQLADFDLVRDGKKLSVSKQKKLVAAIQDLFAEIESETSEEN